MTKYVQEIYSARNIQCKVNNAFRDYTFKITPISSRGQWVNTMRPRRNEQHFADDIFKRIFFNENVWISIKISLKFVPKGPTNNIPALVQIMAWCHSGDKPLSEPMMVNLQTHISVTRPQWVKTGSPTSTSFLEPETWQLNHTWFRKTVGGLTDWYPVQGPLSLTHLGLVSCMRTLLPEAGISGRDKKLHPTVYCGV